jgi:DNA-binding NarL/FixJ family response regulator
LHAIEVIAAGDALISPDQSSPDRRVRRATRPAGPALRARRTDRPRTPHPAPLARGLSNAEIAGRLVISPLTAKSHVRNILRKLDCHDRAGLVAVAYESGLISPGETD